MDVRMPDGTIITGVPDNITQADLLARYSKFSTATPAPAAQPEAKAQSEQGLASIAPSKPIDAFGESKPMDAFGPVKQPFTPEQQKEASFLEELKKGAIGAFEYGLPSMAQQIKLQGSADAFIAKQKSLDLMSKIDSGEFKNFNELKSDPAYAELKASGQDVGTINAYWANKGLPDVASKLRGKTQKDFSEMGASADTSIDLLNKYARENQEKYGARVQNSTDINWTDPQVAADFANWTGHSMGSAGVQLAPIVLAGVVTKQPGVFTLGSAMETAGAVQNRMEAIAKKTKDLPEQRQKEEIKKYLAETGDANLVIGAASGSFDMILGPAAHAARTFAKELMKAGAIKKAIGELPKDMLEEAGTGALQEITQIAGKKILEEAPKNITFQDVKDIVNSATKEAFGAPAGTAINVGRAAVFAPSEKKIEGEEPKREPYVRAEQSDAEALARSKGFLTPEAPSTELLKETEPAKPTEQIKVPKSESQDLDAMMAELEAQIEGKPSSIKEQQAPAVTHELTPEQMAQKLNEDHAGLVAARESIGQPKKPSIVNQLAREEQARAGWNEDWPFVPVDLTNADFRKLIAEDPSMSMEEKQQIFEAGKKLGVVSPKEQIAAPAVDLMTEAYKYNTPVLRLEQSDAFGMDVTTALYQETESYGRAALKNRSLTDGYAKKKDAIVDAADAATIAFGTGDYGIFAPYAQTFPKMAKKLQAHLAPTKKAEKPTAAPVATNLQAAEKDIKGKHDVINTSTQLVNEVIPDTNTVSVADQTQLPGRMTVEVPVGQLQLSEDVPQFKTDANKEGIVEPLGGKFERTGVAPIQVWRREDGRMEVISGRHRFDLAKRSGEETIPAQIHDEKAGFTKDMAAVLDAELNIRDGQGKVKDYVNYFKGTGLDQDTAESRGLLARSPGKRAFIIANQGSDELIAGVRSDKVGDEAAYLIALNAPNDSRLQGVGIKAIQEGKSSSNAVNLMQAVKALASEADTTTDMFGFDDSAMKEAEDMAKIAASKQREVQTRLSAITGAAKNPAVAKAEGIDVRDPEAVKRRINELRQLKTSWDNWSTNPNLISEIRTARGAPVPELQLRGETEAEIRQREATQERDKAAAEQKAIADREVDMFKLQPQVAERGEAPTMDMFGAADMANQPAQTKQAPELTEGLFAQKPKTEQEKKVTTSKTKEAPLSLEYTKALDESREATKEFSKAQEAYRAQEIDDDEFLIARKKYDLATAQFDQAFKQEQNRPAQEVADEVLPAEEKEAAGLLENEPYTFEGEFTEVGEEKQRDLINTQAKKLSDAQTATLEKFYGFARDTEEFADALRQDVVNFITKGATYVNGKIRAIIRSMANGVLSVAVAFNPQFVSMPYTIAVPQFETRIEQVMQEVPASVQKQMSEDAKRAYATIYPAIKGELAKNDKFFIVADKQTANMFVFNPDGSSFMASKTLMGAGIGDFIKGNNNIVSNRITPAGLFDLGLRDAKRSVDEAATAGEYDFGKVFVLDKSQKGANGFYSTTIMHSVWTKETDAKQRLAALQKPGAEDSRYSFGCINVDKATYGQLVEKNLAQMDGAKIFIVPENGADVMSFVNGKATYSTDIIRQRAEPVTKEVKQEVQRAAPKVETERTVAAKEEEGPVFNSIEAGTAGWSPSRINSLNPEKFFTSAVDEERKRSPSFKRRMDKLNRDRVKGKITDEQFVNEADWALKQAENARQEKPVAERVRGADFLRQKLLEAKRKGDLSEEAVDLAEWFIRNNENLVDDLGISVRSASASGVGGQYSTLIRIIILMKDAGSNLTVVHEILHHLERMMPPKVQQAIRTAWAKQLLSAQKKAKTPAEKLYFNALINAHYGNNNVGFLDVEDGEMSAVFMKALAEMDFEQPGNKSALKLAETLFKMGVVPYQNYQFFNPSEFWAVNGADIVQGRFDAVKGGVLARLKNWLKELGQKIKGLFGLDSKASIINALDSLAKGDGKFVTKEMLGEGEYKNISRNYEGNEAPAASWESPEESKMDNYFIYKLQDKLIDTKRVIQSIKKASGEIADNWDAYLKEELFHGRAAKRTQDFMNREMLPILEEMKDQGVTLDQFEKYLHMRHAEERNIQIAKVNPKMPGTSEDTSGSGISTERANKYLADLSAEQKKTFASLAKKFNKIIDSTQKLLVESGLEKQDTIDAWNGAYEHYVPLMRDDLDFKHHGKGVGAGYSTRGGSSKSAVGSTKKVIDIFANVALQRERAIVRAEKARVGRALYGLAIKNPNPGFWLPINPEAIKNKEKLIEELEALGLSTEDAENIIQEPKVPAIDKKTGLVKYQVNPLMRNSDNVFPVRINGEDRYIFFNTSDERAIRMVEALKNLDAEQLGVFLGSVATVTRWIASVNTQYNPVFGLWNFARDVQGAAFNLTTTDIAGHEKEVIDGVFPALKGIYTDLRQNRKKKTGDSEWAKLFEQYELAGGQTGYRDQFSQSEKRANIVKREMKKLNHGNVRKTAEAVFNWLSDYNDAMENAVRLSAFKVALDQGLSEERAASIAKNLTVNFNRKGAASPTLQSLYAFFNAAVQGTTRLVETLRGPSGKKIMAGGLAIGVAQAIALAMAGFDDEDPPEFLKNKNLIIPDFVTGSGNYLVIPMPLGFNIFPGIGRLTTEYVLGQAGLITGAKGAGDKMISMASLILDSFNPLGSGSILQMAAPTVVDPIVAIKTNRDAFGRPISKEDRATAPTPGYTRSRENASWFSKQLAEFLNYVSSPMGTKYTKGVISLTADQIDYLIGQYTGGVGREAVKTAQYGVAAAKGETGDLPSYKVPLLGKLYGETESPAAISSKFYENVTKLAEHENEIKMRIKNKDDIREYRAEHPETRFMNRVNNLENQITAINKQKKALQEREAPEERIKKLDERKTKLMKDFNDQIKRLERQ